MTADFFRFPHTPHLAWLGEGSPRDDKVLFASEVTALLAGNVVVEEKLDGANVGLSLTPDGGLRAQNRGQYLDGAPRRSVCPLACLVGATRRRLTRGAQPKPDPLWRVVCRTPFTGLRSAAGLVPAV
jgi:hypothetical protein